MLTVCELWVTLLSARLLPIEPPDSCNYTILADPRNYQVGWDQALPQQNPYLWVLLWMSRGFNIFGADEMINSEKKWIREGEEVIIHAISHPFTLMARAQDSGKVWATWYGKLPYTFVSATHILYFYMEINFHFECVISAFSGCIVVFKICQIWKHVINLYVDTSLADCDGLPSDQTFLFLRKGLVMPLGFAKEVVVI